MNTSYISKHERMRSPARYFNRLVLIPVLLIGWVSFAFVDANRQLKVTPLLVNLHSVPIPPESISYPEAGGDFQSLTIPVKRAGRLMLIEAVIDGVSGNLVFDTGATGLVLNRTYFRNHIISESIQSTGITGSTGTAGTTVADNIQISDLTYQKVHADISDLGHIENRKGVKIIGLFGFGMIRSFEVVIDIAHNELQLHRIDKKGERLQKPEEEIVQDYVQKIEPRHLVLVVSGKMAGKNLSFCFDTGAETNAVSSTAPKSVLSTISITRRSNLHGAGSSSNEVLFGIMNDFLLDQKQLDNMETIIVNLNSLSEAYGVHIDGMLGYGFISKGIITINLVKKQFGIRYLKTEES